MNHKFNRNMVTVTSVASLMAPYSQCMTIMMKTVIIADEYILMVFGLWLGYSILGMQIVTVDKCIDWCMIQNTSHS